jgi:hypothetical protein
MNHWLQWGLIYLTAIVVVVAILLPSREPWDRLKELLQWAAEFFRR